MQRMQEDFKQRLEEQLAGAKELYLPASAQNTNLYGLLQMIREANSISTHLNKHTVCIQIVKEPYYWLYILVLHGNYWLFT